MSIEVSRVYGSTRPADLLPKETTRPQDSRHPVRSEEKSVDIKKQSSEELEAYVAELQKISYIFNRRLKFSINKELNRVIVKVIDANTDKVIKELPPAELQRLYIRIRETIGLLFDEKI